MFVSTPTAGLDLGWTGPWVDWTLGGLDLGWTGPWVDWTLGGLDLGWTGPWVDWTLGGWTGPWVMEWTPPDGICVPRWRCQTATEGGVHGASYHDRFGHRETRVPRAWSGCCRACAVPQAHHSSKASRFPSSASPVRRRDGSLCRGALLGA